MTAWDSVQQFVRVGLYVALSAWMGSTFADGADGQTLLAGGMLLANMAWTYAWNLFKAKA